MPPSQTIGVIVTKLEILISRMDALDKRTCVLEEFQSLINIIRDHETILRGPDRNDGLITQMIALNTRIEQSEKRIDGAMGLIKAFLIPLACTLIISVSAFVWGVINHTIVLTLGK
jgi:hypothetical protein